MDFNVHFDQWFSEKSIQDAIVPALELLEQRGFLYQKTVICGLNPPNLAMKRPCCPPCQWSIYLFCLGYRLPQRQA